MLKLDKEQIELIEAVLDRHDRVELIATKDKIKVIRIKRREVKP